MTNDYEEFLLDSGLVNQEKIEEVFERAKEQNVKFSDLLLHEEVVSEQELQKLTAHILGVPFVDLEKKNNRSGSTTNHSRSYCKKNTMLWHLREKIKSLKSPMLHPEDLQTIDFVSKKSGLRIVPCFTTKSSVHSAF